MSVTITDVKTPLYQRCGDKLLRILLETTAEQVKTADGSNVEEKLKELSNLIAAGHNVFIKANIGERDAIDSKKAGDRCYVTDATGDPTVTKGAAEYIWDGSKWVKTYEAESLDLVLDWALIQNKPSSAVGDIDDAVAKRHDHANKADVLDKLSSSDDGKLLFDGKPVNDGMRDVLSAENTDAIPETLNDGGLLLVVPAGA